MSRDRHLPSSIRTVGRHARWLVRNVSDAFPNRVTATEYAAHALTAMQNPAQIAAVRAADARYRAVHS